MASMAELETDDGGTTRIEAFSDGVFAIAMTLLVLEIKVPTQVEVAERGLAGMLIGLWPSYLAFVTSFVTILIMWVKHHWMFTLIRKSDHSFLYWNGLLLLFVTFLPFPTALLSAFPLHPEARLAANLYTATILAIAASFSGLWRHTCRRPTMRITLLSPVRNSASVRISSQSRFAPPLYFLAFCLSFASETASLALCFFVALLFAAWDWMLED